MFKIVIFENKMIDKLKFYLSESDNIIYEMTGKYENEKKDHISTLKKCDDYLKKISILNETIKDNEKYIYDYKSDIEKLNNNITILKLKNNKLETELESIYFQTNNLEFKNVCCQTENTKLHMKTTCSQTENINIILESVCVQTDPDIQTCINTISLYDEINLMENITKHKNYIDETNKYIITLKKYFNVSRGLNLLFFMFSIYFSVNIVL